MLPEQGEQTSAITATGIEGTLKPKTHKTTTVTTTTNGGDNIITITTTASINEGSPPSLRGLSRSNSNTSISSSSIITIPTITATDITPIAINNNSERDNCTTTISAHKTHTTSQRIVQFLSKRPAGTGTITAAQQQTNVVAPIDEVTSPPRRHPCTVVHCQISDCISFQENIADVHHRKGRRLNGLQLPLHPLQVFGWIVLIIFGLAAYCVLIPSFIVEIQGPLYGLISGLYIVHVVSHVAALLIDPADRELRRVHRNDRIVPEFDRTKHTHVIENGRCHLCNIRTSSQRTKHCSVCNKCVGKFDHHCKWLNHCIGSRNYVAFLMCVVSAVIATLVIVGAVIAQIVFYYTQPQWLNFWYTTASGGNASASNGTIYDAHINASADDTTSGTTPLLTAIDLTQQLNNGTNFAAFPYAYDDFDNNATVPTAVLVDHNLSALITEVANESFQFNLSMATTATTTTTTEKVAAAMQTNISTAAAAAAAITIAGISISDTIFLVLIAFLGLLAAITAGLLLHLCFFHIYISFLGLTTYEYIRNHRQAQEAKAKNMLSTMPNNNGHHNQHFTSGNPSTKTTTNNKNDCGQIYFCSSLRNPNTMDPTDLRYFEARKAALNGGRAGGNDEANQQRLKLHCCANSREYHQTALKTYYMCSLLEEAPEIPLGGIAHISGIADAGDGDFLYNHDGAHTEGESFKTFHCCSTFAATTTQRRVSAATTKATLVSDLDARHAATLSAARRSHLQFSEQCTFCTFRVRSPMIAKRSSSVATAVRSAERKRVTAAKSAADQQVEQTAARRSSSASNGLPTDHQRCCMKTISKQQRWRRKWNCCASVPDSPDVPNDIIAALAMKHQLASASAGGVGKHMNATDIPVHFIKSINLGHSGTTTTTTTSTTTGNFNNNSPRSISPRSASLKAQARTRNARTWPVARLRHMMRMLNRYRRPRCRHQTASAVIGEQIKQNQIRPLQLRTNTNGCQHHHHHHYYDSSSPQPPSSTTTTASERSSDQSMYSDSSALTTPLSGIQPNAFETILPTSVIRGDDTCVTYTSTSTAGGMILPPALPPPTRRKIPNPTDLEELADTLSFSSHPSSSSLIPLSPAQRLPAISNVYRRQRRKHLIRTRSPTLSPIHESGLSNPTSPQPLRHNTTPTNLNVAIINQLNGASNGDGELMRKSVSNNSLNSISSNSSSN